MTKTKRERFEYVAGNRVQSIIEKLDLLGNCANKNNYSYEVKDVRKMFSAIREKLKITESKFEGEVSKSQKSKFKF
jgi:hypothetical protein